MRHRVYRRLNDLLGDVKYGCFTEFRPRNNEILRPGIFQIVETVQSYRYYFYIDNWIDEKLEHCNILIHGGHLTCKIIYKTINVE
jgi:hypothetical protein